MTHIRSYRIRSTDTDAQDRLQLSALGSMMQETAAFDADERGWGSTHLESMQAFWVLTRMSVRLDDASHWRDRIWIETWPRSRERLLFLRDFRLYVGDTFDQARRVGGATSSWVLLDQKTRRPVRQDILSYGDGPDSAADKALALDAPQLKTREYACVTEPVFEITAEAGDIDRNGHVTNTRYLSWCVDAVRRLLGKPVHLAGFDINYLAEVFYGEKITIYGLQSAPQTFMIGGRLGSDAKPVFRAILHTRLQ